MSKTFFIADVHLGGDSSKREKTVLAFLDMVRQERGDLYILGDLFDFWANNRMLLKKNALLLNKLKSLTSQGQKAGLLTGNRDFLLRAKTLRPYGIDFLNEEAEIILDGKRIMLAHGHTLCLSDIEFLNYKKRIWPILKCLDRVTPGTIENYLAEKFILKSKQVINAQDPARFQFTKTYLEELFDQGINTIICGHSHKQMAQQWGANRFIVLPAWEDKKGFYLLYAHNAFTLHEFKR